MVKHLDIHAKERYDWSSFVIGLSYSVLGIGQFVVVTLIFPYFSRRWSDWHIVIVGLLFASISVLGYTFATKGWMVYMFFACTMLEYLDAPIRAIASAQISIMYKENYKER